MQLFKYNRGFAFAVLAVVIVLSVLLGVNRSLSSLAGKVEDAYTGTEVQSDLTKYVTHARSFASATAALYGENTALTEAIAALDGSATSPFDALDRISNIESAAAAVYYKLQLDADADESVKRSATAYFYEMQSTVQRLGNNAEYAKRASAYNDAINTLPASLLAPGRRPAVTFS